MVNEQYKGLKPGQYMQVGGGEIKNVTDFSQWLAASGGGKNPSVETLAAKVAAVFIALKKRRAQIQQTPVLWQRGETELEGRQLGFSPLFELPRTDLAIQVHRVAYFHKLRNASGRFLGLRWLDPLDVMPDDDTVDATGYTQYFRTANGRRATIPAADIIRVYLPGLRELAPSPSASDASSIDAQVVLGMSRTLDSFFETGGLPVLFIDVPGNPLESVINTLKDRYRRILKREADGQNKMIVTSGGITVTTISLSPDQLDTTAINDKSASYIMATFGVPMPLAMGQAVNETTLVKLAEIFAQDILGDVELMVEQINQDKDVKATNLQLIPHPERMEVMQRAQLDMAEAVQRSTGRAVLTANEGREILGKERIDNDPTADELYVPKSQTGLGFGALPQPAAAVPDPEPSKAYQLDMKALKAYIKNGKHYSRPFNSNELSRSEIDTIINELDPMYKSILAAYP